MAAVGVISDVHGNLRALEAVLGALDAAGVDRIVCLGDLVGYNAESEDCIARLRDRHVACITGNHDLMALGALGFERCSMRPEFSLRRTRAVLGAASRRFLSALPRVRVQGCGTTALIHGGVEDVSQYLRGGAAIAASARRLRELLPRARLCFHGHTHDPAVHHVSPEGAVTAVAAEGTVSLRAAAEGGLFFINPGSVDAARRSEKLAEFAIHDPEAATVTFRRVSYDHQAAERSAAANGYRMTPLDETVYRARRLLRRLAPVG